MEVFLRYLGSFMVGGAICLIAQIFVIRTKVTTSRILVSLVVIGAVLEGLGLFKYIENIGFSGATVPIIGFGMSLTRGAIKAVRETGLLGVFTGGLTASAAGITVSVLSAYLFAMIFSSKTKNKI